MLKKQPLAVSFGQEPEGRKLKFQGLQGIGLVVIELVMMVMMMMMMMTLLLITIVTIIIVCVCFFNQVLLFIFIIYYDHFISTISILT